MTTLLLVRHGETFDNAAHLMQGQVQGQLNETGIAQAEGVRDQMAGEHIDAFVSSDLHRSVQTCEIIAEPHHKPVVQTPLLRERDWGSFTGKYIPDLQAVKEWPDDIEPLPRPAGPSKEVLGLDSRAIPPTRRCSPWVMALSTRPFSRSIQASP